MDGIDARHLPTREEAQMTAGYTTPGSGAIHQLSVAQPTIAPERGTIAPESGLPTDAKARKAIPIASGVLDYFPDAIAAIAECSRIGNEQHNPGKPLHWDRSKSCDESDALIRHFMERGKVDTDGILHSTKTAWRALALLQKEIEKSR